MDTQTKKTNHLIIRSLLLCMGLIVMAFGVAFSIKAGLGTSPISSVPYVTSEISGLSVGCTTIIIYLDPDLVVNQSLRELYEMDMRDYYFAAASHTGPVLRKLNEVRLDMEEESPYINSGVMLMNLQLLRREQCYEDVFEFIEKKKMLLLLPDQDIISSLYGSKIYALDPFRYNMTEALYQRHAPFEKNLDLDWVREHSVIIHYCGRNKPWKDTYIGKLDIFYKEAKAELEKRRQFRSK